MVKISQIIEWLFEPPLYLTFNSLPTIFNSGEQDWDRASFQIGVSGLIQLLTEGRLRHASGPAQKTLVCYISVPAIPLLAMSILLMTLQPP